MEKGQLEEILVTLPNGKVERVVAEKGLSDEEVYALAVAQSRGDVEDADEADVVPPLPSDFDAQIQAAESAAAQGAKDAAINQARSTGQMVGGLGGGALSLARQVGDTGGRAAQAFGRNLSQGLQSPLGSLPGGPRDTPGQRWAAKVVSQPGLNMRPDDYSVSQAAQRYQRAMPSGKVSGPAAKKYGLGPLDIGRQISTAPPRPSGLEAVTQRFSQIANSGPMRFVARKALPPVGGALGLGELAAAGQDLYSDNPDYLRSGLSAVGGLGGLMSMFPATAPVGIPLAVGASMLRAPTEEERRFRDMQATESPFAYGP